MVRVVDALHIRVVLQHSERVHDTPLEIGDIHIEPVSQQDAQVARCRFEPLDMLDHEQHFEQAHTQIMHIRIKTLIGFRDAVRLRTLQNVLDAVEEPVEGDKIPQTLIGGSLQCRTPCGQHRALADGGMASAEHAEIAHCAECGL